MRILLFFSLCILLALFFLHSFFYSKKELIIATGSPEGFYYRMATSLEKVLESDGEYEITLEYTKGSQHNIELIERGVADLAIIQGDIVSLSKVRSITPLFSEVMHVVARKEAGISTFEQAINSRICIGGRGSGMNLTNRRILSHFVKNFNEEKLCELSFTEAIDALIAGKESVAMFFTGINSAGLDRLLDSGQVKYISVDIESEMGGNVYSLMTRYPFYKPFVLPKHLYGDYPQVAINTFASPALLISGKELTDGVAREITKLLDQNKVQISTNSKLSLAHRDTYDISSLAVPIHPGSLSYFERHRPTIVERYADIATLVVTVIFGIFSLFWGAKKYNVGKKRERLDVFLAQAKDIYKDYYHQNESKCFDEKEWRNKVFLLKESSLEALVSNKIQEDERYIILQGEINNLMAIGEAATRHKANNSLQRTTRFARRR